MLPPATVLLAGGLGRPQTPFKTELRRPRSVCNCILEQGVCRTARASQRARTMGQLYPLRQLPTVPLVTRLGLCSQAARRPGLIAKATRPASG